MQLLHYARGSVGEANRRAVDWLKSSQLCLSPSIFVKALQEAHKLVVTLITVDWPLPLPPSSVALLCGFFRRGRPHALPSITSQTLLPLCSSARIYKLHSLDSKPTQAAVDVLSPTSLPAPFIWVSVRTRDW